jgi:hypothetical protein
MAAGTAEELCVVCLSEAGATPEKSAEKNMRDHTIEHDPTDLRMQDSLATVAGIDRKSVV